MKKQKIICIFLSSVLVLTLIFNVLKEINPASPVEAANTVPSTATELLYDMQSGWSLGNALCCCNYEGYNSSRASSYYEKLWGNPLTTNALMAAVRAKGFDAVRIPITYYDHILSDGTIDPDWLLRIKEIVDYVIDNDMYAIINFHHDTGSNGWLKADADTLDEQKAVFSDLWSQIAAYFKDYDNHLIFEGYNEILNSSGKWNYAGSASYNAANVLNQAFVDAIRNGKGYNKERFLIVNTYAASAESDVMAGFVMPEDTVSDKLIVGVHSYVGTNSVDSLFKRIDTYFVSKGIPVIVGEFGMTNNTSSSNTAARSTYIEKYVSAAAERNITCFWWDDGGIFSSSSKVTNYAIINRKTCAWYFDELASLLTQCAYRENPEPEENTTDSINLNDISLMQSGQYNRLTGNYTKKSTRICSDFLTCSSNTSYTADISLSDFSILVNEYDSGKKLITSHSMCDNSDFTTTDKTVYITVTIYKAKYPYPDYSEYSELLGNDLLIYLNKN